MNYHLILPADTHSKCKKAGAVALSFCEKPRDVSLPGITKPKIIPGYTLLDAICEQPEVINFLKSSGLAGDYPGHNVATILFYSDTKVYDIIEATAKTITVRERRAICIKPPIMEPGGFAGIVREAAAWETTQDLDGVICKATLRKNGEWRLIGYMTGGKVAIGLDYYHYDYGF